MPALLLLWAPLAFSALLGSGAALSSSLQDDDNGFEIPLSWVLIGGVAAYVAYQAAGRR